MKVGPRARPHPSEIIQAQGQISGWWWAGLRVLNPVKVVEIKDDGCAPEDFSKSCERGPAAGRFWGEGRPG